MRKILLLMLCAACGLFLFWKNTRVQRLPIGTDPVVRIDEDEENEREDGIMLAQEQDFKNTKDVNLGIIPEDRLIQATSRMAQDRALHRGMNTNALTWIERGPNTDLPGPSGNTRGPGNNAATSGRIRAIWVDLSDATRKTVWVGGVDGGIWKTTDITAAPATWTPVNDFMANLSIADITQDPRPGFQNIMYAGTGEKAFNVDAVRGGGILKSTDGGSTWSLLPSTTSFWNISRLVVDASGNLYAAAIGNNTGIQRSTDGGTTWTNITPTGLYPRVAEMKLSSTGRLHIVCGYYNNTAATCGYRYTDAPSTVTSSTWTSPATSFIAAGQPNYNVEIATAGTTLYALPANAAFETPTVYKSTDGGANWAACATNPPATGTSNTTDLSSGQGWYNLAIGVDPTNDQNVVVGGINTYRSTNGGATWTQVGRWVGTTLTYIHADQHFIAWNTDQVLLASDGGLFYSANDGANWSDRNTGLRIKQFYSAAIHPTTTNYIIGGAQDNGMHVLTSAGLGASTEFYGGDGAFGHIDQDQPQYQFGSYVFNVYRKTTNGGASWTSVTYNSGSGQFINPSDYDDANNKMYAADAAGKYVRWDNPQTGSTFASVGVAAFNGSLISHVMVSPYTGNRVYFGTDGGRIVRVDNADLNSPTATNITGSGMTASTVSCVAVGTTDNNLMATFSNYGAAHVWVSTTGGGTSGWTNITGNLPDIPVRWAMFYPYDNTKAIIATEAGVFETTNINGASTVWTQDPTFPIVRTDMLQYRPSDGLVVAATHGRGMWSAIIPVTNTYVQFGTTSMSRLEATTSTTGCIGYTDYTVYMTVNRAPTGTATATLNLSSPTATQGLDYDYTTNGSFASPSNVITLANASTTPQPITLRIYNDAAVESAETFTLSYTLSGTTDAQPAPSSQTFTFTINSDDAAPTTSGSPVTATIGTYNTGLSHPFRSDNSDARTQMVFLASEMTAAGFSAGTITSIGFNVVTKVSTAPFSGLTIKMKNTTTSSMTAGGVPFETGATTVYGPIDYSTVSGMNTFTLTTPFIWDGTSNVMIDVCFDNAAAGAGADLVQGMTGTATEQHDRQTGAGISGCSLANANFIFTGNARPLVTFSVTTSGNQVETVLNASRTENIADGSIYHFYNGNNIMDRISGSTANLGCVTSSILEAGNTWQTLLGGQRSGKVFTITPTTNSGASYVVGLYYTSAELAGKDPATLRIGKTSAATMAGANSGNTVLGVTNFTAFGTGYLFTAAFNGFSNFFLVDAGVTLPITLMDFTGHLEGNKGVLNWSTSSEQNSKNFDIEKSTDGTNYFKIGSVNAAGSSSARRDYGFTDAKLSPTNYYRLRMNDLDGRNKLSPVVIIRYNNTKQDVWIVNNPFNNYIDVRFAKAGSTAKLQLINNLGAVVAQKTVSTPSGQIRWDLPINLSSGNYVLKTIVDNEQFISKLVKQ